MGHFSLYVPMDMCLSITHTHTRLPTYIQPLVSLQNTFFTFPLTR